MARYSSYKPTNIPWLPEVPEEWEVKKVRQFVVEGKNKNNGMQETNILSLSYGKIIRKQNLLTGLRPTDYSTYQIVEPGQVVLRLTDLQNDHKSLRCGLVKERGIITSAYVTLIPKGIISAYLYRILHTYDIFKLFYSMGDGLRQTMNFDDVVHIDIPVPPLPVQERIVAYLDEQCSKIDKLVSGKTKQIALLKELRERTIADAVTRGMSFVLKNQGKEKSEQEMCFSGIFWQSKMPKHWVVRKLKYVLTKLDRLRLEGAELLVCTNKGTVIRRGDSKMGLVSEDISIYQGVAKGDLLIHGMDTWHGAIAVSEDDGMCTPVVHVCDSTQNKRFIAFYLRNMARGRVFKLISNGVRQNTSDFRSWEKVAALPIILPPLVEQNEIVAYLDERCEKIDTAVKTLEAEVERLKEYRERLIADVVTGQSKVE